MSMNNLILITCRTIEQGVALEGGKTTRENCIIECYVCHDRFEKKPELRNNELLSR